MATPVALTIAGSDSSGGAGIQADLKTFAALGVYGASVITALTAQNTKGVSAIHSVPGEFVTAQLDAVFGDLDIGAVKIGMVGELATIEAAADAIRSMLVRGAPLIGATAAYGMALAMRAHASDAAIDRARAAGLGQDIRVRVADRELSGRFETLDADGNMTLRLPDGRAVAVTAGDTLYAELFSVRQDAG